MLFIFSTLVLIRHLWQLETIVFLHWCLICVVLLSKNGRFLDFSILSLLLLPPFKFHSINLLQQQQWRHDYQHNDTQHNDTQHNHILSNLAQYLLQSYLLVESQCSMLCDVILRIVMLIVGILSIIMLNVAMLCVGYVEVVVML